MQHCQVASQHMRRMASQKENVGTRLCNLRLLIRVFCLPTPLRTLASYSSPSGTFFPSTGMTLWQRCLNVFLLTTTKVIAYVHWHWGPISR